MIFQPAIIALLLASGIAVLMLAAAAPFAVQVIRRWDIASGSERQLALERRTYLFSTLLAFVFAMQLVALLLFVFNADRLAVMFVGAMCAVGTLNVNGYGFPALMAQVAVFFLAAMWLAVNHVDTRAPDYPLVRVKYILLLGLLPVLVASFWLQLQYFLGLKANVITSCCGSLFSGEGKSLSGDLSALSPQPAILLFFTSLVAAMAVAARHWQRAGAVSGAALGLCSAGAFAGAVAGILSFLSLYIYEHPHHHCPFCILKPEYDYRGYALYLPLFIATAAGLGAGVLQCFRQRSSLQAIVPRVSRRLAAAAGLGYLVLAALAAGMMAASNLLLVE